MTMFNALYMETLTKNGNKTFKAIKRSELSDDAKALKKTLENIWDKFLDVAQHPDHTVNAAALPALWESAYSATGIDSPIYQDVLRSALSFSQNTAGECRLCSRAAFVKRFVRTADMINAGTFSFLNKQSAKAAAEAEKVEKDSLKNKLSENTDKLRKMYDLALKNGMMSPKEYDEAMADISESEAA